MLDRLIMEVDKEIDSKLKEIDNLLANITVYNGEVEEVEG